MFVVPCSLFLVSCPLLGCEMRVAAHRKPVFGPILGGFRASNRFLVQFPAGFGLQIDFWPNSRRVSGFKSVFGPILGGFRASNRFLVQSSAGFGLQIDFWPNPRRVLRCLGRGVLNTPHRRPGRDGRPDAFVRPRWGPPNGANAGFAPTRVPGQTSLPRQRPPLHRVHGHC